MLQTAPVAVIIPTYGRGKRVFKTLDVVMRCDPRPEEIWVHVDGSDGRLEEDIKEYFPSVRVISSAHRVGPGGGRHRCIQRTSMPLAVSFDDDSYPYDVDFFSVVVSLFAEHPEAAVIGGSIWHRQENELARRNSFLQKPSFTGCGHAVRISAYNAVAGYVARSIAYGLEETDLSLQLFARKYKIYESGDLRVFHDTELQHHQDEETVQYVVANTALLAFLRYPIWLWVWGLLQLGSTVAYCLKVGRWRGIVPGVLRIPRDCLTFRRSRRCIPSTELIRYFRLRRAFKGEGCIQRAGET
jgi:GT2 family glycosyltransferase